METGTRTIRWFETIGLDNMPRVGGENAFLGGHHAGPGAAKVRVPNGFAVTAEACGEALRTAEVRPLLDALLDDLDVTDEDALTECAAQARLLVYEATGTEELRAATTEAYRLLEAVHGENVAVAVQSSATAETLPTASFAGLYENFLNIRGAPEVFEACRNCLASRFTDRAIVDRVSNGSDHFQGGPFVQVIKMAAADMPR